MKNTTHILASLVTLILMSSVARAQTSVLWFDVRDDTSGDPFQNTLLPTFPFTLGQDCGVPAFNGGGPGDGQVLRVSPRFTNGWHVNPGYPNFDLDGDLSTATLWLYMSVGSPGCPPPDTISAIALDFTITNLIVNPSAGSNRIAAINFSWADGFLPYWDAFNYGNAVPGDPPRWEGAWATLIPPGPGAPGLAPSSTPYLIGRLDVLGDFHSSPCGDGHLDNSMFNLHMRVGPVAPMGASLPIQRTCGGPVAEIVSFGFDPSTGGPEVPAVNGGIPGATTTVPDAEIHVHVKHDANGDGRVNSNDWLFFLTGPDCICCTAGATNQTCTYLHDGTDDKQVFANDIPSYLSAVDLFASSSPPLCDCGPDSLPRFIRVSQEVTPGAADFVDLGCIEVYDASGRNATLFYNYDPVPGNNSYNGPIHPSGPEPTLMADRSHLFFVHGIDGVSLFTVHDNKETSGDGGTATMSFALSCDPDGGLRSVEDDPSPADSYTGDPCEFTFTSNHVWLPGTTDGLVVSRLDGRWEMLVEFTVAPAGLSNGWHAYSQDGSTIPMVLLSGRRVRLDFCCLCKGDMNADGVVDNCDIPFFVDCLLNACGECDCADVNLDTNVNALDIAPFTALAIAQTPC